MWDYQNCASSVPHAPAEPKVWARNDKLQVSLSEPNVTPMWQGRFRAPSQQMHTTFFRAASSLSKHGSAGQINPPSGDCSCPYRILPHACVNGWEILGLSGGFQVQWGGRGTHTFLPGASIPREQWGNDKQSVTVTAGLRCRCGVSTAVLPAPHSPAVGAQGPSITTEERCVCLHWTDTVLLPQELSEQLGAVLQKVWDIWYKFFSSYQEENNSASKPWLCKNTSRERFKIP